MKNKKKIGIVTLHMSNNYGAMYQVYALSKVLKNLGYEVFVLNYCMESTKLSAYLKRPVTFVRKILAKKVFSLGFLKSKTDEAQGKKRETLFGQHFANFRAKYLNITPTEYDYASLQASPPNAYAYITGSDQVWATDFEFMSPAFLLGFVPKGTKRIAYAPSFGKGELEPYLRSSFKTHIQKFDAISVREKSGVKIVENVGGLKATHVLDPTLLLENYEEIIDYSLVPKEPYIFTYRLGQEATLSDWMSDCLNAVADEKGLPIYSVTTNSSDGFVDLGTSLEPTPGQMLGLIKKAAFFATNSFHGTVFALQFKTQFLTFARDMSTDKQNLRLTDLLKIANAESVFCGPYLSVDDVVIKSKGAIDFDRAHNLIAQQRVLSNTFLNDALK